MESKNVPFDPTSIEITQNFGIALKMVQHVPISLIGKKGLRKTETLPPSSPAMVDLEKA